MTVVVGVNLRGLVPDLRAQQDITDAELDQASAGRTVALGALGGGRLADIPLEIYVARVLAGEAEPGAPDATTQALAVAVRTYAVFNAGRHRSDGFDVCDTTHCQVPRTANASTRRAALATAGQILTYQRAPAEIFYSASCGGRSETAAAVWGRSNLPYLRVTEDDVHDDDVPWTLVRTLDEIAAALERVGFVGRLTDIAVVERTESGRAGRIEIAGLRPDVIGGNEFRLAVGAADLRSTAFAIRKNDQLVTFIGRGYGHGVGMCVIGAGRRARRGESVEDILKHYYPGLEISNLRDAAPVRLDPARTAPGPRTTAANTVTVRVPPASTVTAQEVERLVVNILDALSQSLEMTPTPVTVQLHSSLESFRAATNQPWWVSAVVAHPTRIDVAPAILLAQREGIEPALRVALAEHLLGSAFAGQPAWVRMGAARYFARQIIRAGSVMPAGRRERCPSDADLRLAGSAAAQREAEARAEACFAREYARTGDWKAIKADD